MEQLEAKNSLADSTDAQLVERVKQSDQDAFAEIVRRYEYDIRTSLVRYCGIDDGRIDDHTQDTFFKFFLRIEQYDSTQLLRPYLVRIARNIALDYLRKKKNAPALSLNECCTQEGTKLIDLLEDSTPPPDQPMLDEELHCVLANQVCSLKPMQRDAIEKIYMQGQSFREAAEELSIPMGTVKSRVSTALTTLRTDLPTEYNPQSAPH